MTDKLMNLTKVTKKKTRTAIPLIAKLDVLKRLDAGENRNEIANSLGISLSTIIKIREDKDKLIAQSKAAAPTSVSNIIRHRSNIMERMENLLSCWIEDQNQNKQKISSTIIREQAKRFFNELQHEDGASQTETFSASNGWFENFKKRHQLKKVRINQTGTAFATENQRYIFFFKKIINENDYKPQQVFNVAETVLFWNRMPDKIYSTKAEKCESIKKHVTLFMGGNASGDFKLKPLFINQCEKPIELKGISKMEIPFIWRSNKKATLTETILEDWFKNYFSPTVKHYCTQNNIPNKILLILDGSYNYANNLNKISDFIKVIQIPSTVVNLIQPMSQGVLTTCKLNYLLKTYQQLLNAIQNKTYTSIEEFWKHYNIKNTLDNLHDAWNQVKKSTVFQSWRKLWPEIIENINPQPENYLTLLQTIVNVLHELGFTDITDTDLKSLVESNGNEFAGDELYHFKMHDDPIEEEEEEIAVENVSNSDDTKNLTPELLLNALNHFESGLQILTTHDPDKQRSSFVSNSLNDLLRCYRILYDEKLRENSQRNDTNDDSSLSFFLQSLHD